MCHYSIHIFTKPVSFLCYVLLQSFQNKGFWTVKGTGRHINDRERAFDNPSKIEPKRPHQWYVDATEVDFFPNKKQAVEDANGKSGSGNVTWENNPSFNSVPNQFMGRLFGSESRPVNFTEKNSSYPVTDDSNVRAKTISNQYREDASFGLSISPHSVENTEASLNFGGIKKVKVSQVKDSDCVHAPAGFSFNTQNNSGLHQTYNGEVETGAVSVGQAFDKDSSNVMLMGLTYNVVGAQVRSLGGAYGHGKGDDNVASIGDSYSKEDTNAISFGGFPDVQDIIPVGRPTGDYSPLYNQSSAQVSTTAHEKELDAPTSNATLITHQVDKLKPESMSKNKQEFRATRKEAAPNSFPSNVRSLLTTRMLDGVPVKYVSVSREVTSGLSCLFLQHKVLFNNLWLCSLHA